jgi:drug/metabolite transporter (DMT)-like permease
MHSHDVASARLTTHLAKSVDKIKQVNLAAVLGVAPADFGPLLTPAGSMGLAFAVLGVTCLGYSLKALGLKHLPTSTATAYSAGQPAVAVLIAAATLGEPLTPTVGIGITGVTGALVVLARLA